MKIPLLAEYQQVPEASMMVNLQVGYLEPLEVEENSGLFEQRAHNQASTHFP